MCLIVIASLAPHLQYAYIESKIAVRLSDLSLPLPPASEASDPSLAPAQASDLRPSALGWPNPSPPSRQPLQTPTS